MYTPELPELSALERVFDFRSEAFYNYMYQIGRRDSGQSIMEQVVALNDEADIHPLVQYAVGSAALEAAMYKRKSASCSPRYPLFERLLALEIAKSAWTKAGEALSA